MPSHAFWKGYLKLSLVTCAVAMRPVVSDSEKVKFHTINRATGNRIQNRYVDAVTSRAVDEADQVKGYPRGEDDYVMLEDDELDAVALESTHTIDIESFVPKTSLPQIWYDTPHFLLPNDKIGEEAFAVIREAMRASGMVGISRLVLYRRERAVMLAPRDQGIILWTLRYADEVRDEAAYFGGIAQPKLDATMTKMVAKLIAERTKDWTPAMAEDPVQERLLEIVAAKRKAGTRPKAKAAEPKSGNIVNIMDALRASLKGKGS